MAREGDEGVRDPDAVAPAGVDVREIDARRDAVLHDAVVRRLHRVPAQREQDDHDDAGEDAAALLRAAGRAGGARALVACLVHLVALLASASSSDRSGLGPLL
jgi:hypothetical protein